jgi:hypothetical protein
MVHGNVKLFLGGLYAGLWAVTIGCAIHNVTRERPRELSLEEQVERELEERDQMILYILNMQPKQNSEN